MAVKPSDNAFDSLKIGTWLQESHIHDIQKLFDFLSTSPLDQQYLFSHKLYHDKFLTPSYFV